MRFCRTHGEELRRAIDERGLSHLVSKSDREAAEKTLAEAQGTAGDDYDPLLRAHWMILHEVIRNVGPYLLTGDYCPLCEAVRHSRDVALPTRWINGCANAILRHCMENGRVAVQ